MLLRALIRAETKYEQLLQTELHKKKCNQLLTFAPANLLPSNAKVPHGKLPLTTTCRHDTLFESLNVVIVSFNLPSFCWLSCKIYMLPLIFHDSSPVMSERTYQICFLSYSCLTRIVDQPVSNNAKLISEQVASLVSQPCTTWDTPTWLYIFLNPQK